MIIFLIIVCVITLGHGYAPWKCLVAMNARCGRSESPHTGLVRTIGLCAQRRVALISQAIARASIMLCVLTKQYLICTIKVCYTYCGVNY